MSSPFPTLIACLSYVYLVKVLGPRLMENRKPFQLKNVLIAYNAFQVVFSAWLFYEVNLGQNNTPNWISFDLNLFPILFISFTTQHETSLQFRTR